jgi:hypothetical protein
MSILCLINVRSQPVRNKLRSVATIAPRALAVQRRAEAANYLPYHGLQICRHLITLDVCQ